MGVIMEKIYKIVEEKAGHPGRMELASQTGIPRTKAAALDDNPENVKVLTQAASKIINQDVSTLLE